MAIKTEIEHFLEEDNIGNYQWVTFNDFIGKLEIMASDADSYLSNTRRSQFINVAKQGIKLLQRTVRKDITPIEFTVPKNLLFPYPQDYVNWVSLSLIYDNELIPIMINKGINTALKLQLNNNPVINPFLHSEASLSLLQNEGLSNEQETEGQAIDVEQTVFIHSQSSMSIYSEGNFFKYDENGNIIKSPTEYSTNHRNDFKVRQKRPSQLPTQGQAVFNDTQNRISFGSDMDGMSVVLEYYSDGLFAWSMTESERKLRGLKPIRIHKDLEEVLIKYVYQEIIGYRRNVPANEKQRAKQEYKTYLHKAKLDKLGFRLYALEENRDNLTNNIQSNPNRDNNNISNSYINAVENGFTGSEQDFINSFDLNVDWSSTNW